MPCLGATAQQLGLSLDLGLMGMEQRETLGHQFLEVGNGAPLKQHVPVGAHMPLGFHLEIDVLGTGCRPPAPARPVIGDLCL